MKTRHLLLATELSPAPERPDGRVLQLARGMGADITLLHVVRVLTNLPEQEDTQESNVSPEYRADIERAERALGELAESFPPDIEVSVRVETGTSVSEAVVRYSEEKSFDLISIFTHGRRGAARLLLGSVAQGVLRRSSVPVLCIPPRRLGAEKQTESIEHILLTTDLSVEGQRPFEHVTELAAKLSCRVTVLHVMQTPLAVPSGMPLAPPLPSADIQQEIETARSSVRDQCSSIVDACAARIEVVCHDDPARGIVEFAETNGVDLITLSTHGRTGFRRFALGSVAEQVMRSSPVPVLSFHRQEQ